MKLNRNRFTIYPKLLIGFLIAILPVYLLGILLNQGVANSLREQILQSMQSNVKFYLSSLADELNKIEKFKESLVIDEDLMTLATVAPALSENELREAILRMERKLTLLQDSSSYIADVTIHIPLIDKGIKSGNYKEGVSLEDMNAMRAVMQKQESPLFWWDEKLMLASYYPDSALTERSPVFLIEVEIDRKMILHDLRNAVEQGGAVLYFNGFKKTISNHALNQAENDIMTMLEEEGTSTANSVVFTISDNRYLVSMQKSLYYDMTLAIYTPESYIMSDFEKFDRWFWLLFILSMIVIVMFSYWIFKAIRTPLRKMLKAFRKVEQGQLSVRITQSSNDEFRDLSDQFNKMVGQLQALIQEVYEQQIRRQQSELKQLQSQINPHFLYNSFFILHQLIEFEDIANARKFVHYLGNYFQYITRDAKSELPLGQEIKHAEAYVNIQTMRFGPRIDVQFQAIPQQYEALYVPRLIVQPIIENAYQHGLESKVSSGKLHMTNETKDGMLYIRVEDNGSALTTDELYKLREQLYKDVNEMETTGMINVHRRLQIKFGPSAGVDVYRNQWNGLGVAMRIPVTTEEENKCIDC
ncbi:histidine kinase [Paenibacillus sp. J5C_2022]|uniref:sensor histidine kinase n=1 Tax=Paenibacillus sp. J5C2022 TaxID=2977129 RepID=UPI0021CE1E1F|nr:histidine kinase [Paenibacillus sp. J5C2022]MCU6713034.1 histidine kinase [Paenibacillus sp. J5C2022]